MVVRRQPTDELLSRAAELRAAGVSWEKVGEEVGRAADTVRKWPAIYRARWQRTLAHAEQVLLAEATAEAVHTLRRQLRSTDEKASREAAQKLIQLRIALDRKRSAARRTGKRTSAAVSTDGRRIAHHLGTLTDVQIDQIIAGLPGSSNTGRPESTGEGD